MAAVPRQERARFIPATRSLDGSTIRWLDVALLSGLTVVYLAAYASSVAIPDSTRDIYAAYRISIGEAFPTEGPVLGGAMHGGPAWFYLLSLPLLLHRSWLGVLLFAGLVAGLKFALAYVCGSRLIDRRFGLLWAVLLALPGWSTIEPMALTNANVAQTCILASLYFSIRVREAPGLGYTFLLGIVGGLGFHAHPTTLPAAALSLGVVLLAGSRHRRALAVLVFGAAFIVPFVPYLLSQALQGFPDLATGTGYVESNIGFDQIANAPGILRSVLFEAPLLIARDVVGLGAPQLSYAKLAVTMFLIVTPIAAIWNARTAVGARQLGLAAGAVALFVSTVAWLRRRRRCTSRTYCCRQLPRCSRSERGCWRNAPAPAAHVRSPSSSCRCKFSSR